MRTESLLMLVRLYFSLLYKLIGRRVVYSNSQLINPSQKLIPESKSLKKDRARRHRESG